MIVRENFVETFSPKRIIANLEEMLCEQMNELFVYLFIFFLYQKYKIYISNYTCR